jgi:GT2 family glycosyltransferase
VPKSSLRKPRISVVTPLFNCLAHTQAMVASLQRTLPAWVSYEIILVDDGSTDGTREWLAGLGAPFRVVLNERNLGYAGATNRGAAVARGRILALLNNDLVLSRGWLRPMLSALSLLGRRAGLVGNVQVNASTLEVDHAGIFVNLQGKPEHIRARPALASLLFRPAPGVFAVTGACVLVRADTWGRLGGFDEAYINGCEDIDLCLRAREEGLENVVALRSSVLHHVSSSPGRKLRDEENTRRLVLHWRRELAVAACRPIAREHFIEVVRRVLPEPRDFPDKAAALRAALFLAHLSERPPEPAVEVIDLAIDRELARWREMFSNRQ